MNRDVRIATEIWLIVVGIFVGLGLLGLLINYLWGGIGLACAAGVAVAALLWLMIYADITKTRGNVDG